MHIGDDSGQQVVRYLSRICQIFVRRYLSAARKFEFSGMLQQFVTIVRSGTPGYNLGVIQEYVELDQKTEKSAGVRSWLGYLQNEAVLHGKLNQQSNCSGRNCYAGYDWMPANDF